MCSNDTYLKVVKIYYSILFAILIGILYNTKVKIVCFGKIWAKNILCFNFAVKYLLKI